MEATTKPGTAPVERGGPTGAPVRLRHKASLFVSSAVAAFLGVLPHVLHHAGPLAGAALFAGAAGSLLFGALGLIAAIPFLLRLRRRSGGWRLPLGVLALFAAIFSISSFVIGPAISDENDGDSTAPSQQPAPSAPAQESAHEQHH